LVEGDKKEGNEEDGSGDKGSESFAPSTKEEEAKLLGFSFPSATPAFMTGTASFTAKRSKTDLNSSILTASI
jgi:hypothetical protein